MIPGTGAGNIQKVSFGVVDLLKVSVVSNRLARVRCNPAQPIAVVPDGERPSTSPRDIRGRVPVLQCYSSPGTCAAHRGDRRGCPPLLQVAEFAALHQWPDRAALRLPRRADDPPEPAENPHRPF